MSRIIAIVPARTGSRGIANKNFRELAGVRLLDRAVRCASEAGIQRIIVTSDAPCDGLYEWLVAPAPLHTDTCPMIDVVKDVLARVPGEPDDIFVLLQPTQPLRRPEDVRRVFDALTADYDSAFSVVEVPHRFHRDVQMDGGEREAFPSRRQDLSQTYVRDGTAYIFRRSTVMQYGTIYGRAANAVVIDAAYSCPLDTPADWAEAERRLNDRIVNSSSKPSAPWSSAR
jgi:CMP-N-acetylneuraminic acid synthetase